MKMQIAWARKFYSTMAWKKKLIRYSILTICYSILPILKICYSILAPESHLKSSSLQSSRNWQNETEVQWCIFQAWRKLDGCIICAKLHCLFHNQKKIFCLQAFNCSCTTISTLAEVGYRYHRAILYSSTKWTLWSCCHWLLFQISWGLTHCRIYFKEDNQLGGRTIFQRYGYLEELVSNYGPLFITNKFTEYLNCHNIIHNRTAV